MLLSYYSARMHRENIKNISPKSLEEHCTWCNIQMNATLPFPKIQVQKCGLFHFLPHNKNMNLLLLHRIFPNRGASSKRGLTPFFFAELRNWSCNTNAVATHENLSGFPDCASDAATTLDICFTR